MRCGPSVPLDVLSGKSRGGVKRDKAMGWPLVGVRGGLWVLDRSAEAPSLVRVTPLDRKIKIYPFEFRVPQNSKKQ